jgi:putative redox protein
MAITEDFDFTGSQGQTLAGRLHRPDQQAVGSILMAHCFSCSKDLSIQSRLANGLADAGYAVLRFDFTGLGQSGGDFADTTLTANVSDLTRAAASLIAEGFGPCGMLGHSLGGAAAVLAAEKIKTVRSLATIAAPAVASHVSHLFGDRWDDLRAGTPVEVTIGPRPVAINPSFALDLDDHDVLQRAAHLNRPYAIFHAEDDDIVGFDNAEALYAAAAEPKRLVRLPSGQHLFVKREDTEALLAEVLAWFNETLLD